MDAQTFLAAILPSSGIKMVARIHPRETRKAATIHYAVDSAEAVADMAHQLDAKYDGDNIYFALASYRERIYKTAKAADGREFKYLAGRTQANAHSVKSLWLDLDVGKEGAYASQREAAGALKEYLRATRLPLPIMVSSGYGLHVYWPFTDEVPADEWENIARHQRAAWKHFGLKADPACDADCARILRVPGTTNRRAGRDPKTVRVLLGDVNALPASEYLARLSAYTGENSLQPVAYSLDNLPEFAKTGNLAAAKITHPTSFASIAVVHCRQLMAFQTSGGGAEPLWHARIGAIKHCADGAEKIHEWSQNDERYSPDETQAKIDNWTAGPTTCDRFRELDAATCEGCERKCRAPIQLGLPEVAEPPPAVETPAEPAPTQIEIVQPYHPSEGGTPPHWPSGFIPRGEHIYARVKDDDGVFSDVEIASPLFYPVSQTLSEDGTFCFKMVVWVGGTRPHEFLLPCRDVADKRALARHLSGARVAVKHEGMVMTYMRGYLEQMTRHQRETGTYRQMGWHNDFSEFLIGDRLITRHGIKQVDLHSTFPKKLRACFGQAGDPSAWVEAVDSMFNRPNGEPYQLALCLAFGGVLSPLLDASEWNGIPLALTSDESGYGKTTVNRLGLSIWMKQDRDTIFADGTAKSILGYASAFNSVPFLLDETTKYITEPAHQTEVLYALSNGVARDGMNKDGAVRTSLPGWCGCAVMTSNRNIWHHLSENKLNPEATQMRVFEVDMQDYPRIATMVPGSPEFIAHHAEHSELAKYLPQQCYGVIGPQFIQHVMADIEGVRTQLRTYRARLEKYCRGDASKERFYYYLVACAMVGGKIAKKLGFIRFDINHLTEWCIRHIERTRETAKTYTYSASDNFARMLSDIAGHVIVTTHFHRADARTVTKGEAHQGSALRNPIYGRYATGDHNTRPCLFLTTRAVRDWCTETGVQFNQLRRDLIDNGTILTDPKTLKSTRSVNLSKGVIGLPQLGYHECFEFRVDSASSTAFDTQPDNVIPLNATGA